MIKEHHVPRVIMPPWVISLSIRTDLHTCISSASDYCFANKTYLISSLIVWSSVTSTSVILLFGLHEGVLLYMGSICTVISGIITGTTLSTWSHDLSSPFSSELIVAKENRHSHRLLNMQKSITLIQVQTLFYMLDTRYRLLLWEITSAVHQMYT